MRVVVVGAGIIGTTSAFRLKKMFPDLELRMIAAELSPDTTSDIAAGWWEPHLDPDTDPQLVRRWAEETYALCTALQGSRMWGKVMVLLKLKVLTEERLTWVLT